MPIKQITSSRIHPSRASMKEGEWRFAMTGGKPGRLFHKFSGILHEWPTIRNLDDYLLKSGRNYVTLTDDSMADALHRHSELSASDGTPDAALQVDAAGKVSISNDLRVDTDLLFVDIAPGRVGIGTTPATDFHVVGESIFMGGNVGIGTSSPGAKLYIYDSLAAPDDLGDFDNYQLVIQGGGVTGQAAGLLFSTSIDTYGGSAIVHYDKGAGGLGDLVFYTKQGTTDIPPVEAMRLDSAGNLITKSSIWTEVGANTRSISIKGKADLSVIGMIEYITGYGTLVSLKKEDGTQTTRIRSYGDSFFNGGNVGIGVAPIGLLTVEGSTYLKEQAAAAADTAAYGQLWVKTATPNELWFTDDAGGDHQIAFV